MISKDGAPALPPELYELRALLRPEWEQRSAAITGPTAEGTPTVEDHLKSIQDELHALNAREASGEDVDEERQRLQKEREELESKNSGGGSEESELERLRRESAARTRQDTAKAISSEIVQRIRTQQASEAEELTKAVQSEVAKQLQGGDMQSLVKSLLGSQRSGSRFAGEGASDDVVAALAGGGEVEKGTGLTIRESGSTRVTGDADAKQAERLLKSKSLTRFMAAAWNAKSGRASRAEEVLLGLRARDGKALAEQTDSSGGFIIPPDWMPDVLKLLRAQAIVRRAAPRFVPITKTMNQVSLSSGAVAYYEAENATIPKSEETFNQAPLLTPHNLTGLVPVSNYLLRDSIRANIDSDILASAEDIVRSDLTEVMALREDLSFLRGTGTGGEPTGLRNLSGVVLNPIAPGANGFSPTLPQLRAIRNYTRRLNVRNPRWVWFFNPQVLSNIEQLTTSFGQFLADAGLLTVNDDQLSGVLDGVPFFASNQIPINLAQGTSNNATDLMLVNMNETVVGINTELEIDVSSEASYTPDGGTTWISAFQQQQTLFRSLIRHDISHRYPGTVIVQSGVLA